MVLSLDTSPGTKSQLSFTQLGAKDPMAWDPNGKSIPTTPPTPYSPTHHFNPMFYQQEIGGMDLTTILGQGGSDSISVGSASAMSTPRSALNTATQFVTLGNVVQAMPQLERERIMNPSASTEAWITLSSRVKSAAEVNSSLPPTSPLPSNASALFTPLSTPRSYSHGMVMYEADDSMSQTGWYEGPHSPQLAHNPDLLWCTNADNPIFGDTDTADMGNEHVKDGHGDFMAADTNPVFGTPSVSMPGTPLGSVLDMTTLMGGTLRNPRVPMRDMQCVLQSRVSPLGSPSSVASCGSFQSMLVPEGVRGGTSEPNTAPLTPTTPVPTTPSSSFAGYTPPQRKAAPPSSTSSTSSPYQFSPPSSAASSDHTFQTVDSILLSPASTSSSSPQNLAGKVLRMPTKSDFGSPHSVVIRATAHPIVATSQAHPGSLSPAAAPVASKAHSFTLSSYSSPRSQSHVTPAPATSSPTFTPTTPSPVAIAASMTTPPSLSSTPRSLSHSATLHNSQHSSPRSSTGQYTTTIPTKAVQVPVISSNFQNSPTPSKFQDSPSLKPHPTPGRVKAVPVALTSPGPPTAIPVTQQPTTITITPRTAQNLAKGSTVCGTVGVTASALSPPVRKSCDVNIERCTDSVNSAAGVTATPLSAMVERPYDAANSRSDAANCTSRVTATMLSSSATDKSHISGPKNRNEPAATNTAGMGSRVTINQANTEGADKVALAMPQAAAGSVNASLAGSQPARLSTDRQGTTTTSQLTASTPTHPITGSSASRTQVTALAAAMPADASAAPGGKATSIKVVNARVPTPGAASPIRKPVSVVTASRMPSPIVRHLPSSFPKTVMAPASTTVTASIHSDTHHAQHGLPHGTPPMLDTSLPFPPTHLSVPSAANNATSSSWWPWEAGMQGGDVSISSPEGDEETGIEEAAHHAALLRDMDARKPNQNSSQPCSPRPWDIVDMFYNLASSLIPGDSPLGRSQSAEKALLSGHVTDDEEAPVHGAPDGPLVVHLQSPASALRADHTAGRGVRGGYGTITQARQRSNASIKAAGPMSSPAGSAHCFQNTCSKCGCPPATRPVCSSYLQDWLGWCWPACTCTTQLCGEQYVSLSSPTSPSPLQAVLPQRMRHGESRSESPSSTVSSSSSHKSHHLA